MFMTRAEFLEALRTFGLDEGSGALTGPVVLAGPALEVSYGDDDRPTGIVEIEPAKSRTVEVSIRLEPDEIDAGFHFSAAILGELDSEELVHVLEEGPYHDHVFLNLHDEGLATVEDLIDADDFDPGSLRAVYSDEAYEDVAKQTRIEWQPFFQNPVARSLRELLATWARPETKPQ